MPGHIGTSIVANSRKILSGNDSDVMTRERRSPRRAAHRRDRRRSSAMSTTTIQAIVAERARRFLEEAPMTAAEAATVILDGVKAERWRILVGEDAAGSTSGSAPSPERAYDAEFFESVAEETGWKVKKFFFFKKKKKKKKGRRAVGFKRHTLSSRAGSEGPTPPESRIPRFSTRDAINLSSA